MEDPTALFLLFIAGLPALVYMNACVCVCEGGHQQIG